MNLDIMIVASEHSDTTTQHAQKLRMSNEQYVYEKTGHRQKIFTSKLMHHAFDAGLLRKIRLYC